MFFISKKKLAKLIEGEKHKAYHQGYGDGYTDKVRIERAQTVITGIPNWQKEIEAILKGEW
jgi:hypothetical protein